MSGWRLSGLFVTGCLALLTAAPSAGQAPEALAYRRVLVPQDALDAQIRGLLPLRRDEFERRVQAAEKLGGLAGQPAELRIAAANYRAKFQSGQLIDGLAKLEIVAGTAPGLLPLTPCSIAIESGRWLGETGQPAVLGVDPRGVLSVLVERSGTLELGWSQRGERAAGVGVSFDLQLPAAPRCQLEIETSADEKLKTDAGLIVGHEAIAGQAERSLWKVEFGGRAQSRIAIHRPQPHTSSQSLGVVRETASYALLPAAIDLDSILLLDVLGQPLTSLTLEVDPALEVTAIKLGEQPLEWTADSVPAAPIPAEPRRLIVNLPAPLTGLNRALHITATGNWPAGPRWSLPRVRLVNGVLQEGRVAITAPPWLRLTALPLAGCVQTAMLPAGANRPLDEMQFQLFSAAASIEIAAQPHAAPLHEQSGTDLRIEASQISGVLIAELSSLGGDRFSVDAVLPRHWLIDAVETQPADMLADRQTTPRGATQQTLRLHLARALNESRPLRLVIRAHFRRPAGEQPLPADFFRLATFPEAREGRRLVAARVIDSATDLKLSGDEQVIRLAPQELTTADSRLFESPPGGLIFAAGSGSELLRGSLAPTAPRYRADVLVQAQTEQTGFRETIAIRCQPEAAAVPSLLVRLTPKPAGPVSWRIAGEELRELSAAAVESPSSEEVAYRITLARRRTTPFELRGEMAGALGPGRDVCVAWLPEATSQTGLVEVSSLGGEGLAIDAASAERLPARTASDERFTPLAARFRYDAGRRVRIRIAPAGPAAVWIERLELLSRFSADGLGDHEATLHVVNAGQSELRLHLPPHVSNVRAAEGSDATSALIRGASGAVVVTLPPGQRHSIVRLRYSSSGQPLGLFPWGECIAWMPQLELPVLDRRWKVSLEPGLAAWTPGATAPSLPHLMREDLPPSWQAALTGPNLLTRLLLAASPPQTAKSDPAWIGWTNYELELPASGSARLTVYRADSVRIWGLCCSLVAAAVVLMTASRTAVWLPLGGITAAAAMLLAAPWSWLLAAIATGLVAGGCLLLWRPQRTPRGLSQPLSPGSTIILAGASAGGAILLALLLTQAGSLQAAETPKRWRVVIPVDEMQQPTGDYVYLESEFYEAILKLSAGGGAGLPTWLLESAHYEIAANPHDEGGRPALDELRVQFDLQTWQSGVSAALPLRRDQVSLLEGRARLDGQRVTLAWRPDGSALDVPIAMPGRHHLELALGVALTAQAEGALLDLALPAAARATLALPAGSAAELFSASGVENAAAGQPRNVPLGAARRLQLRWPATAGAGRATNTEVEQLVWWRIRPGSVVAEGRFRVRASGGSVRELLLDVDPRLRLVPNSVSGTIRSATPTEGNPRLVRVELAEPAASEVTLTLSWLWLDASGPGTLVLPAIAAHADHVARTWTAASTDPQWKVDAAAESSAIQPADFLAAWGDPAAAAPALASAPAPAQAWMLQVAPRAAEQKAEETIDWSLSATSALVQAKLKLSGVVPTQWTQRVALSPQLQIKAVAVEQNGQATNIRWTQDANWLTLAWLEPPAPDQQWTIAAEMPVTRQRPRLQVAALRPGGAAVATRLRVFRHDDLRVALQDAQGWTKPADALAGQYVAGLGRLVVALQSPTGGTQPRVNRSANAPQVAGAVFTRVQEEDGDWQAEVRLDLTVADGLLDQLRLSVPAEWSGPLTIEPAVEQRLADIPGDARRELLIRPLQAAQDRLQLTIRGPLIAGPSGIQAPEITFLTPVSESQIRRLVLLDTHAGSESVEWETMGLQGTSASEAELPAAWLAAGGDLRRAVAPRFSATARIRQASNAAPHVALADHAAHITAGRRATLTSIFTIHPHGAAEAVIAVPPLSRLVQVQVDGALAAPVPAGLRNWKIAAPTLRLPYRMTVVTDQALPEADKFTLAAPHIANWRVERTTWSIAADMPLGHADQRPLAACSRVEVELLRAETLAHTLETLAAALAMDLPPEVLAEIFQATWRQLQAARAAVHDSSANSRLHAAEQMADRAKQRLLAAGVLDLDDLAAIPAAPPAETSTMCYAASGAASEIGLVRIAPAADWTATAAAALLAAASVALFLWLRTAGSQTWLATYVHLLLAAAGVIWWLLAPWGFAGWLLVLAALWLALRWPWPRRAYNPGSTIRRFA